MSYAPHRRVALEAVLRACGLCQTVQKRLVADSVLEKGDKSPVTVADFGAQAVVSHLLGRAFPDIPLVGEEDASALRDPDHAALRGEVVSAVQSVLDGCSEADVLDAIDRGTYEGGSEGLHFTLDPIDGTKGFLRLEQYAVALALIEDGEVVLGVLGCPQLPLDASDETGDVGCIFVAVRGEGAFMRTLDDPTERSVKVGRATHPEELRLCESVEKAHTDQSQAAQVAGLLGVARPPYRMDSQCKYAAVARGDATVYLRLPTRADYVEKIWDHAAGWAVVTEAGGTVTDCQGEPLDFSCGRRLERNRGVIATHGPLHAQVVRAVQQVLEG